MVQLITIKCQILGGLLMAKFAISRALKKCLAGSSSWLKKITILPVCLWVISTQSIFLISKFMKTIIKTSKFTCCFLLRLTTCFRRGANPHDYPEKKALGIGLKLMGNWKKIQFIVPSLYPEFIMNQVC